MKLLPNWKDAWKWFSVQIIALAGAVQLSVLAFPQAIQGWLPDSVTHWVAAGLLATAVLARLVDQNKPAA